VADRPGDDVPLPAPAVVPANLPANLPVVDVRDHGAVGDGVTNDHPAVVRALYDEFTPTERSVRRVPRPGTARGYVLYFPPGRYRIDGLLDRMFVHDNITIRGAGRGVTTLAFDQHDGQVPHGRPWHLDGRSRLAIGGKRDRPLVGVTIEHLTLTTDPFPFEGSDRRLGATVLTVGWSTDVRVTDVEVCGVPSFGMYLYHCRGVTVEDCHVHHTHVDGIHVSRSERVTVRGCRVHDTGDDAISISGTAEQPGADIEVVSNTVHRSGSNGISVFGVSNVRITDNAVHDTYQAGIGIRPYPGHGDTTDVVIADNRIDGAGLYPVAGRPPEAPLWGGGSPCGIAVANDSGGWPDDPAYVDVAITGVVVRSNRVERCRDTFVAIRRAAGVTVVGNTFTGPLLHGARDHDGGERGAHDGGSGVFAQPAPYDTHDLPAGPEGPTPPAIRCRDSADVRIEDNTITVPAGRRAVLIERGEHLP